MKHNPDDLAERKPYMEAFVASASDVIKTMAMKEPVCGSISGPSDLGMSGEVGAVIELSEHNRGAAALLMGRELAGEMIGSILGRPGNELTAAEIRSGVLEIINMIAGGAKSRLSGTPWHFTLSIPRDCSGEVLSPALFPVAATLTADLTIDGRTLTLMVALTHNP